jgi:hypothetical protein
MNDAKSKQEHRMATPPTKPPVLPDPGNTRDGASTPPPTERTRG